MEARRSADAIIPSSWPGLSRPSTSCLRVFKDVDARLKAGHDEDDRALITASLHRRVHPVAQEIADILALPRPLHHEHGEHILLRIDPEEGAGHAAPEELAE